LFIPPSGLAVTAIVVPLAVAATAKELGWITVPLIQPRRQTNECWKVHGRRVAGLLWGFDLGLLFTTWFTFAGTWLVPALAFATGKASFGAALFVAYWLGRALPIWLAPALLRRTSTLGMLRHLSREYRTLQLFHAGALCWLTVLVLLSLLL
jgi:cytochrome c biogenesis protein CcdA